MSLEIRNGRFFCTTTGTDTGPQCRDDAEAAELAAHVERTTGRDIRALWQPGAREKALAELRSGELAKRPTCETP